jgi:glycyl-tRNA synthetase beta chain
MNLRSLKMTGELLFELGTEEIPADYLDNALLELGRLAENSLREKRIGVREKIMTFGTPRRLVLIGKGLAERQEDALEEITGPPKKAAFDAGGNPTKAAVGFAQRHGVSVEDLRTLETPKGEYLYLKKRTPGKETMEILSEVLLKLVADIPWPKSMRWGTLGFSFVRPIHWIVALFDGRVIPFEVAGVKSGDQTRGHRFMSPQSFQVKGTGDYLDKIRENFVLIDREERASKIQEGATAAAGTARGTPVLDPELLATVTNMVEFPSTLCGSFDKAFLQLPDPVLITVMKKHQKYFAVRDPKGRLMAHFVAVNNTVARDETVVRRGHERVLRARLSDADFFFRQDREKPMQARLEDLKGVVYQAQLGTSYAKVQRFTKLAEYLSEQAAPELKKDVSLAAALSKCDLVTEMVTEFPELQGVMGKEYARLDGHSEAVCLAIHEHYLPVRSGDELPSSPAGSIVGLADRMDTVTGFFAIGMEPTGAADPFALRRHALAIIRILEKMEWEVSLREFIFKALSILREEISFDEVSVFEKVLDFFRERYRQMMLRSDYSPGLVEAVITAEFDHLHHLRYRFGDLKKFVSEFSDLESLALMFKRMVNILKNQTGTSSVRPELLKEPCELQLWKSYQGIRDAFRRLIEDKKYFEALNLLVTLKAPVDEFFAGVEILTRKDETLRNNRVALLKELTQLFLTIADFSKFAI